jgi:SAM-dependent methyltransferase
MGLDMTAQKHLDEYTIINWEKELREWFTCGQDELMREIDGLDIGWGGSQRWVTSNIPDIASGRHLDFACGYGTFLAQIGWRFPKASLYGLNIDYEGPHASIKRLLDQAGVQVTLIQSDAREMPFANRSFDSVSCFLGLQDIQIGFGQDGVRKAVSEAARVLKPNCCLTLADDFTFGTLLSLLDGQGVEVVSKDEFALDIKWSRRVAEAAIGLYSEGWAAQSRVRGVQEREKVRINTYQRMKAEMELQLRDKGFYVPHGPVRMVVAQKYYERSYHRNGKKGIA